MCPFGTGTELRRYKISLPISKADVHNSNLHEKSSINSTVPYSNYDPPPKPDLRGGEGVRRLYVQLYSNSEILVPHDALCPPVVQSCFWHALPQYRAVSHCADFEFLQLSQSLARPIPAICTPL
jgi:hypothetical protein